MDDPARSRVETLRAALQQLRSAIDLLDQADAPAQIAAYADLAAQQLHELLEPLGQSARPGGISISDEERPPS